MPSKPQFKDSAQSGDVDFVLKHRIAGAGFLLFFGALVLPWLLGPPSEAIKLPQNSLIDTSSISEVIEKSAQQSVTQTDPMVLQEQVYISKITPLDRDPVGQSNNSTSGALKDISSEQQTDSKEKLNEAQAVRQNSDKKTSVTAKLAEGSSKLAEGSSKVAEGSSKVAEGSSKVAEGSSAIAKGSEKAPAVTSNSSSKDSRSPVKPTKSSGSATPKVASQASTASKVDVGWVVQVGVFTDKRGAAKVVDDLRDKGFNPSTSIVDTNRGKATGTRIWLGPYAQRVEAAKAKSQLTSKTGEAGFIRAYP